MHVLTTPFGNFNKNQKRKISLKTANIYKWTDAKLEDAIKSYYGSHFHKIKWTKGYPYIL